MVAGQFVKMMSIWQGHRDGWKGSKGRLLAGELYQILNPESKVSFGQLLDILCGIAPLKSGSQQRQNGFKSCKALFLALVDASRRGIMMYQHERATESSLELWSAQIPGLMKLGKILAGGPLVFLQV
jgi:hypothetical protein